MRNVDALFDEVSAAFQFPFYFGENWAAFAECLADLSWVNATKVVMIISRFEEVLVDEPSDVAALGRALKSSAHSYNLERDKSLETSRFRLILNGDFESRDHLRDFFGVTGPHTSLKISQSP